MDEKRTCGYCGQEDCRKHSYKFGRRQLGYKGGYSTRCENISAQTTFGEFKKSMSEWFSTTPDDTPGVWMWSFSKRGRKIDDPNIGKTLEK